MKKLLLSAFTIISFIIYGVYQKSTGAPPRVPDQSAPTPSTLGNNTQIHPLTAYKDGVYTGGMVDAFYGYIQVQVVINNKQITDVKFLRYPNDRQNSMMINMYAMPILKQEAIQAQSANVNIVSGATASSQAFIQSLNSALSSAI
jgi:uncharacterized protein with FMN-binding domain